MLGQNIGGEEKREEDKRGRRKGTIWHVQLLRI
jgi:hypothetical protein